MTGDWQTAIPEVLHDAVRDCFAALYGHAPPSLTVVSGGASGAVLLRVQMEASDHLVRVEAVKHPDRNPHQYEHLAIAARAGVAPPVHYTDAENGVAVVDFVDTVPLEQFPGGHDGLLRAMAGLVRQLQSAPGFAQWQDFREVAGRMLGHAERWFEPGVLDGHREAFDRLCSVVAWDSADHVASHNDPNPSNLLFDGTRLWLIDWEMACRNDRYVDLAIIADRLAANRELRLRLLEAWLERPAEGADWLRLVHAGLLTRVYYAGLYFLLAGDPVDLLTTIDDPSPAPGARKDALVATGRTYLRRFADGWARVEAAGSQA